MINNHKKQNNQYGLFLVFCFLRFTAVLFLVSWLLVIPPEAEAALIQKSPSNLGLVGYWSMNEGTGSYAGDSSGNKNTGTLTNGPTWVDGKRGKALSFDGSDDFVSIPANSSLDITTSKAMTITAWVNPKIFACGAGCRKGIASQLQIGVIFIEENTLYGRIITSGSPGVTWISVSNINSYNGLWFYVTLVFDKASSNTAYFYVNGVKQSESVQSLSAQNDPAGSTNVEIGRSSSNQNFNGLIDEVRIYNRALTPAEIKRLYNMGR